MQSKSRSGGSPLKPWLLGGFICAGQPHLYPLIDHHLLSPLFISCLSGFGAIFFTGRQRKRDKEEGEMGACASKSKALEGEGKPVTLEEPTEISKTSEAVQKQEEEKQIADAAEEARVSGGGEDGRNNHKSLGVLMSEIEHPVEQVKHPTTTTEDSKTIVEVETTEEDQPKAVYPVEKKSAVIAEQSVGKVESETGTLVAELSTTKQDQSFNKVEFNASPPQISQNEVEEQPVDLAEKSAIIAEQCVEKVESETGSAIAEISKTVMVQSEQDQFVEKVEPETGSAVAEVSKTVVGQSEQDQFVEKAEVYVSASLFSHEEEEQSKAVDVVVKSAAVAKQPVDKVESVSATQISKIPTGVIEQSEQEQALEKIEQKEGGKSRAEEHVDKFESRTESAISEITVTASEQPLEMTELEDEQPQISQKQAAIPEEHEVEGPAEKFEPKDEKPIAETATAIAVEFEDRQTSESKLSSPGE